MVFVIFACYFVFKMFVMMRNTSENVCDDEKHR